VEHKGYGVDAAPTGLEGLFLVVCSTKISLLTELAATTGNAANRHSALSNARSLAASTFTTWAVMMHARPKFTA
jgi:hypothetical protein